MLCTPGEIAGKEQVSLPYPAYFESDVFVMGESLQCNLKRIE